MPQVASIAHCSVLAVPGHVIPGSLSNLPGGFPGMFNTARSPLGGDSIGVNHHKANDRGKVRQETFEDRIHLQRENE